MKKYFKISTLAIFLFLILSLTGPKIFAEVGDTQGITDSSKITIPLKKLLNGLDGISINIDPSSFINRFKSDFKAKNIGSLDDIGPKISDLWNKANAWMDSHLGLSLEEIGRFIASIFIWIFEFLAGILRSII